MGSRKANDYDEYNVDQYQNEKWLICPNRLLPRFRLINENRQKGIDYVVGDKVDSAAFSLSKPSLRKFDFSVSIWNEIITVRVINVADNEAYRTN